MRIGSKPGFLAWWLNFLVGAALVVTFGYLFWLMLPDVVSGESPPARLLPLLFPLVAGLLIMVRSLTARHHEWIIGDNHIRIRSRKPPDLLIAPAEIDSIEREHEVRGGDRDNGLPYVRFVATLKDGRTFASPYMTDDARINRAWRRLEALLQRGR